MRKIVTTSLLVMLLMCVALVSASLPTYPEQNVGEQFTFCQTCSDASYITLSSIQTPNETQYINVSMNSTGNSEFCYNYTPQLAGRYDFRGVSDGCTQTFAVIIDVDTPNIVADLILLLFFSALIFVFYSISTRMDYDAWHKKIETKYDGKNAPKVIVSSFAMTLFKNPFLIYYLLGWPILILIRNMIAAYGISSISGIFDAMGIFYTAGLLLVIFLFWGRLQEFVMDIFDEKNLREWGI